MLQPDDAERIDKLKRRIGARSKVDVVRAALTLLECTAERAERAERWTRAVKLAKAESQRALRDFRGQSRLRRPD
jgi:hypothetical protein